jgi:tetratricopeptide (TPR) repeat protein
MNPQLVEVYLDAENDLKNNNYTEAFKKYESILFDEPGNAATHNSLGWIYKTQMDNYSYAEKHYLAAINSEPDYPYAYINYAILLMDQERFDDMTKLIQKALDIATTDKPSLYYRLALASEIQLKFDEAVSYYQKAILFSLNDEKIKSYRTDIERVEEKKQIAKKHSNWLGKLKF